eukprot:SAG31_NODE_5767_length_2335_cov_2.771020_2_plen_60_part_00
MLGQPMEQVTMFPELDFSTGTCENINCQAVATWDIFTDTGGYHVCIGCARQFEAVQSWI